jgi:uncharacterized protein
MQGKLQQTYRIAAELGRNASFTGDIPLSKMPRLSTLVIQNDTSINVYFEFGTGSYQHAAVSGHYKAEMTVECQRCLEPMVQTIDQDFYLLIDATEEDIQSFAVDTVYSSDGYLDVFEVVEDELILSLPVISMHADTSCNRYLQPEESLEEHQDAEINNPFEVLKALKRKD